MPPTCRGKPAIRHPAPNPTPLGPEPASASTPAPNHDFFQEFIRTYIEKVRDQALATPTILIASDKEASDNTDRSFKPQNPDLYYGHLYMECYYFYQQGKDDF